MKIYQATELLAKADADVKAAMQHPNKLGAGAKKRKQLRGQKKVHAVMKEFKEGTLHSGSGETVTDRDQAIAIAMSEAGMSRKGKKGKKAKKSLVYSATELLKALPKEGVEGGHKSAPKGYPKKKKQYADPKNFKYPLDTEKHVRAAIAYFSKPKNAGVYSPEQQRSMWARMRRAAKKLGIEVGKESGPAAVEKKE